MTGSLSANHSLAIFKSCPFPVLVLDNQGRVESYNRAFEYLLGHDQARDMLGQSRTSVDNHTARLLLGREKIICLGDQNSHDQHFEIHCIDLPEENHREARLYVDISKQVQLQRAYQTLDEELKQQILTDPVTGLLNQRGILLALEPQVARSRRYSSPISVIILCVEACKTSETTKIDVARLLKDQLRWADLVGCSDHHEFILVLPETAPEAASRLACNLEKRLSKLIFSSSEDLPESVRYGVTGWRKSDSATTLLARASTALSQSRSEPSDRSAAV